MHESKFEVTLILYGGRRNAGPKATSIGPAEKRRENGLHLFLDEAIEVVEFADAIARFVNRRAALVDGVPRVFTSGFPISASFIVSTPSVAGVAGVAGVARVATLDRPPNVQKPPDVIV